MRFITGPERNDSVPRGGFRAYVQETDLDFEVGIGHWRDLKKRLIAHVRANPDLFDIADEDLDEWAETLICVGSHVEASHCDGTEADARPVTRVITIGDVLQFLRVVQKWIKHGFKLVPQEEAERRAKICTSGGPMGTRCRHNDPTQGCLGCANLLGVVMEKLGNRKTSVDARLQNCGVCSCNLKALAFCPDEVIRDTAREGEVYPDYCWKNEIISGERPV